MAKSRKQKARMICPFCRERIDGDGNYRAFAVSGIPMHIRMKHPERYAEFKANRDRLVAQYACDENGNLTSSTPVETPIPDVAQEVVSEPEPSPEPVTLMKGNFRPEQHDRKPHRHILNPFGF